MSSAFPSIEDLLLTLGARRDNFAIRMEARCRTAQEAQNLNAQLRTVTSLLQSTMAREKKKPDVSNLSGALTAGQFRQSDRMVYGDWTLDKALVESLIGK
jgi:hypothetical protein